MFCLIACGISEVEDDPADEQVVSDGKSDAFGYTEGSPEAIGILKVANETSLADLQAKVGLTKSARANIVADRPFATLTALDATPYVGKTTFEKLLAYAIAQGYVGGSSTDPFDPASCQGAPMTQADAVSHFNAGSSYTGLGTFTGPQSRSRTCNQLTGCGAWSAGSPGNAGDVVLETQSNNTIEVAVDVQGSTIYCYGVGSGPISSCGSSYAGVLTNHCLRLAKTTEGPTDGGGNHTETEAVVLLANIAHGCTRATCAAQHAACGNVTDDCGGTLSCGSCGSGEVCSNNQCVAACSCTGGRVCCPGSTGCWDACF